MTDLEKLCELSAMPSWSRDDVAFVAAALPALLDTAKDAGRLRADEARLDWLEGEGKREGATKNYDSLFRRNVPITRAAIDAEMGEGAP